jgi:predicted lipid-binding transport protein (Tim44 family)
MDFSSSIDIIIFAMVAAFLVLRLRSVLGRRTGNERRRADPFNPPKPEASDKVMALPDRTARPLAEVIEQPPAGAKASPLDAGIAQVQSADASFTAQGFLDGAKAAFEMIVEAFARGDRDKLRPLLSDAVYDNFSGAIKTREDAKQSHTTTLIGIRSADLLEARLDQRTAYVTVKILSEQVNVTRDKDGNVVEGDPNHVADIVDIWTFARNTRNRDPNWVLVETRTEN